MYFHKQRSFDIPRYDSVQAIRTEVGHPLSRDSGARHSKNYSKLHLIK